MGTDMWEYDLPMILGGRETEVRYMNPDGCSPIYFIRRTFQGDCNWVPSQSVINAMKEEGFDFVAEKEGDRRDLDFNDARDGRVPNPTAYPRGEFEISFRNRHEGHEVFLSIMSTYGMGHNPVEMSFLAQKILGRIIVLDRVVRPEDALK